MADHGDERSDPVPPREASPPVDPTSTVATPDGNANAPWRRPANLDPQLERFYQQIESQPEPLHPAPDRHVNPYTGVDSGISSVMFRAQRQWGGDGGESYGPTGPATAGPTAFGAGADLHHNPGWPAPLDPPATTPSGMSTDGAAPAPEAASGSAHPAGWPGIEPGAGDPSWSFTGPATHTDWFPPHSFSLGLEPMYTHIDTEFPGGGEQFTPTHTPGEIINPPLTPSDPMPAPVDHPPLDLTPTQPALGPPIISPTPDLNPPIDPASADPMPAAPSTVDGGGYAPENQAPFTC